MSADFKINELYLFAIDETRVINGEKQKGSNEKKLVPYRILDVQKGDDGAVYIQTSLRNEYVRVDELYNEPVLLGKYVRKKFFFGLFSREVFVRASS